MIDSLFFLGFGGSACCHRFVRYRFADVWPPNRRLERGLWTRQTCRSVVSLTVSVRNYLLSTRW